MLSTRLAETIKKLGLMPGIITMEEAKLETTGGKTNLAREKVSERLCPTLASRTGSRKVSVVFPRPSSKTGHNGGKRKPKTRGAVKPSKGENGWRWREDLPSFQDHREENGKKKSGCFR